MAVQSSTAASDAQSTFAACKRRGSWSNVTHRVEDRHSAGMAENGTSAYPQSIDSRQSGRPHDQGHDSRETDQVWTCSELARIILHSLGPTCIVTSVTFITETLAVWMNTVNSLQNHRLTVYRWNLGTKTETVIDTTASPLQTVLMNPPNANRRAN